MDCAKFTNTIYKRVQEFVLVVFCGRFFFTSYLSPDVGNIIFPTEKKSPWRTKAEMHKLTSELLRKDITTFMTYLLIVIYWYISHICQWYLHNLNALLRSFLSTLTTRKMMVVAFVLLTGFSLVASRSSKLSFFFSIFSTV